MASYQKLIYDKQVKILYDKIEEAWSLAKKLDKKIEFIFEVFNEIKDQGVVHEEKLDNIHEVLVSFKKILENLPLEEVNESDEVLDEKNKCFIKKISTSTN